MTQASLRILSDSPEPSLLANTKYGRIRRFKPTFLSLALLDTSLNAGLVARKPVFGVSYKVRSKPVSPAADTG